MTFGVAVIIVLAGLVILLGLVTFHLATRLSSLETALEGGLTAPTRPLAPAEYAARFSVAVERSGLASEFGDGLIIFLGGDGGRDAEVLDITSALPTGRGLTLVFARQAPARSWPDDTRIEENFGERFAGYGVSATPFGIYVQDGRVRDGRILGNDSALFEVLGDSSPAGNKVTPLEVD